MSARKAYAVGSGSKWDSRRNTSMKHEVPAGEGLRVAALLRAQRNQEWSRWITGGRPVYTPGDYARIRKTGAPVASTPEPSMVASEGHLLPGATTAL